MRAGVIAALATILTAALLRLLLGVPLPVELVSDRLLPFIPVELFVGMLGIFGGPILSKQLAFYSSFLGLLATGALIGLLSSRLERRRLAILAGGALGLWLVALAALWPALASNYRGLPPGQATLVTAAGLLVIAAVFVVSLAVAERRL